MDAFTKALKILWGQSIPAMSQVKSNCTVNTMAFLESALELANFIKVKELSEERKSGVIAAL